MFGFLWRRPADDQPTTDPPTEKQLRYAARLGITVPPAMSKAELSAAIAKVERQNTTLGEKRERVKTRVREQQYGKALIADEARWNRFADEVQYMLAVYRRGGETVVDVLRVNEALIDGRGKLKLGVEAPKVIKDRHIGTYLDWDRHFELPVGSLLYHEPLHPNFPDDGLTTYQKTVERGLRVARNL